MSQDVLTLGKLNSLLFSLQAMRGLAVHDLRDMLTVQPGAADLLNRTINDLEALVASAAGSPDDPPAHDDRGLSRLIGLGPDTATTLSEARAFTQVTSYDDKISRDRLAAVGDLYYIYQHERAGVFRAVFRLQQLFQSGEVRLSDGVGAVKLYQFDRKRVLRYTQGDRKAIYRRVFGYTEASPPAGAEPNSAFHALLSNFCQYVSRYFEDKRVSEVVRPSGSRETFGSMAVVRRSGLDLRANLKQVSYGHVAVLRTEVMGLLSEAFDVLGAADVRTLFGADNAWDVLEEIMKRYMREIPVTSQRSRMASAGREILRWLAEDYLLNPTRVEFEALLQAIVDPCEDWLTSAESLGLQRAGSRRENVVAFRPATRPAA